MELGGNELAPKHLFYYIHYNCCISLFLWHEVRIVTLNNKPGLDTDWRCQIPGQFLQCVHEFVIISFSFTLELVHRLEHMVRTHVRELQHMVQNSFNGLHVKPWQG